MWKIRPVIGNFWRLTLQLLTRGRRGDYAVRIGRQSPRFVRCKDIDELRFLLLSVYCSSEILPHSEIGENSERLLGIYRTVRGQLEAKFTGDEIRGCSTGGWPSVKEVVLYCLTRRFRPEEVIETGVAQGISSVFILEALRQNGSGHLTSIDLPNFNPNGYSYEDGTIKDPTYVKQELGVGWLVPDSIRPRWSLLIGRSQDILPTLATQPHLFFHDSKHTYDHMMFEFEWAWNRLRRGGVLVSDDISWNRAFSDFLSAHSAEAVAVSTGVVGVAVRVS